VIALPHAVMRIRSLTAVPLSVPLLEPFVIASATVAATRAALVRVTVEDPQTGERARGLGEAATLYPVTSEDQPDLLGHVERAAARCTGLPWSDLATLRSLLEAALPDAPVTRAGIECAVLDACARLARQPLCTYLGGAPGTLVTDITLPIMAPAHMADLATGYWARGFTAFKAKVGKHMDDDLRALLAVHTRVPGATYRLDANAGFDAATALQLCAAVRAAGLHVECFEQPCATDDLDAMAKVTRDSGVPVIADESVKNEADLAAVIAAGAAHGVNLKLAKSGGLLAALALGRAAKRAGLQVMCGGMVETRLGMSAMAHVACALGGAEYLDLDTAFLLAEEHFHGGYEAEGPRLRITGGLGLDIEERKPAA
jgi:L-Ala-D/L-Glu epimerase